MEWAQPNHVRDNELPLSRYAKDFLQSYRIGLLQQDLMSV